MSDGRIPLLSEEAAVAAAGEVGVSEYVTALNLNRVLLRHPQMAKRFIAYFSDLMFENQLPARLRELAIMRIAWMTGSTYEWTQHWPLATGADIAEDDLLALRGDWDGHTGFSDADRAVLAATDDVIERGRITTESWERCAEHLADPAQLIELVLAIAGWRMVATILQSLEVPLEDGNAPWPPDGRAPEEMSR